MKPSVAVLGTVLPMIGSGLVLAGPVSVQQVHLIDFEGLPGVPPPFGFSLVPGEARLTDQFASLGVLFGSEAGYAAIVALGAGHATSGVNGIGGVLAEDPLEGRSHDELYLGSPIFISFVDPQHVSQPGRTNFFSIRSDLISSGHVEATVFAFDVAGNELARVTRADVSGQTWTVSAPGIHRISIRTEGAGPEDIAFDDVRFAAVQAIPLPPALVPGALLLAGVIAARSRQR